MKLLEELQSLNAVLVCFSEAGSPPSDATLQEYADQMASKIVAHDKFSVETGTRLIKFVGDCAVGPHARSNMLKLIQAKIDLADSASATSGNTRCKNTTHYRLQHFLTRKEWDTLCSAASTDAYASFTLAKAAIRMGITCPCEKTYTHWAAITMLAKDPQAHQDPDHQTGAYMVMLLKNQLKTSRPKNSSKDCLRPLPNSVEEFKQWHPVKFAATYPNLDPANPQIAGPVPSPLDDSVLEQLRLALPARCTHRSIASRLQRKPSQVWPPTLRPPASSLQQLWDHFTRPHQLHLSSGGLLNFQLLGPHPGSAGAVASGAGSSSSPAVALPAPPLPPPSSPPPLLALSSPEGACVPEGPPPLLALSAPEGAHVPEGPNPARDGTSQDLATCVRDMMAALGSTDKSVKPPIEQDRPAAGDEEKDKTRKRYRGKQPQEDPLGPQPDPAVGQRKRSKKAEGGPQQQNGGQQKPAKKPKHADHKEERNKGTQEVGVEFTRLPFPGRPLEHVDPKRVCGHSIYTCIKAKSYRVKGFGERKDKAFFWRHKDPELAWDEAMTHIEERLQRTARKTGTS